MGVVLNGEARAYPVSQMRSREIANDELGGIRDTGHLVTTLLYRSRA